MLISKSKVKSNGGRHLISASAVLMHKHACTSTQMHTHTCADSEVHCAGTALRQDNVFTKCTVLELMAGKAEVLRSSHRRSRKQASRVTTDPVFTQATSLKLIVMMSFQAQVRVAKFGR